MEITATVVNNAASLIGRQAPVFNLQDQDGRWVRMGDLLAHGPIVLAFYPTDFSQVCTKQLCDYRDSYEEIQSTGVRIVGISPDPPDRHREFITSNGLQFLLLSDPDQTMFRAYGVVPRWLSIRTRGLFIIRRNGIVLDQRIESTMFTHRGAADVVKLLESLKEQL
jgi:peroxiredoxin Q/BCP